MNVALAGLLPGIRDVRAPLAAGYIWLFSIWMHLHDKVPKGEARQAEPWDAIFDMTTGLSVLGLAAALSFVAYLTGVLSVGMSAWAGELAARAIFTIGRAFGRSWNGALSSRGFRSLDVVATDALTDTLDRLGGNYQLLEQLPEFKDLREQGSLWSGSKTKWNDYNIASPSISGLPLYLRSHHVVLKSLVGDDLGLVKNRLLTHNQGQFELVDRMESEAELRVAIIPPVAAAVVFFSIEMSPWWWLGVLPLAVFFRQASKLEQKTLDTLVDLLFVGELPAPSVERLSRHVEELIGSQWNTLSSAQLHNRSPAEVAPRDQTPSARRATGDSRGDDGPLPPI